MASRKITFINHMKKLARSLADHVSTSGDDWSIKGFIDVNRNVYTISSDTKMISKILEIQLLPKLIEFAHSTGYEIVLPEKQNWYPNLSFVCKKNSNIKFAVDIKTTYRLANYKDFCNGFTLGSHGEYFKNRKSTKNVQFPYGDYLGHVVLGALYTRVDLDHDFGTKNINELDSITSVITDFLFFAEEKWKIASDKGGSGNTANIGSIDYIPDVVSGNGAFANLGENLFDEYWTNRGILEVKDKQTGDFKKLTKLSEFLEFKGMDPSLLNPPAQKRKNRE
ncbi:MAG: EcoRV family type II restriction endonuclease [Alphaproteobacteria bacterium]|nr:EcoRV family type II restriction endonuclease [Alphaproteobacteria bacterium]